MPAMNRTAHLLIALLVVASACVCSADPGDDANGRNGGKPLRFRADGTFKILQVADVHYVDNRINTTGYCKDLTPQQQQYPCTDKNSTDFLAGLLEREQPDLVVFTGDNNILDGPADPTRYLESYRQLMQPLVDAKVPWMLTFGNHDCEGFNSTCREDIVAQDKQLWPTLSYTKRGPRNIDGVTNYAYTLTGNDGQAKVALYVMDGGAYLKYGPKGPSGYDFVRPNQVEWYNRTAQGFRKRLGSMLPSVLFVHMPLPEYDTAWSCQYPDYNPANPSIKDFGPGTTLGGVGLRWKAAECSATGANFKGVKQEGSYPSSVNGGLFSSLAVNGEVKMVNVGHDHVNDFCATMAGIRLCYGGGFGYHAYNTAGFARRARVIVLKEDGSITTWKRLDGSLGNWATVDMESF